ncbi:MAG: type IX secretion system plug protein domain-containing protein, partial [Bacteroidota bacterium]
MSKIRKYLFLSLFLLFLALINCEPVVPQQSSSVTKKLILDDHNYEELVGNCQVLPMRQGQVDRLGNPVLFLGSGDRLLVEFDLLEDEFENLTARIVHCNKNWSQSRLRDMEFLASLNDYRITEFNNSVNTIQPYVNYQFTLPSPKISGNYILVINRRNDENDLLITRKFIVVESLVQVEQNVRLPTDISKRDSHHQIEFSINYDGLFVNAPATEITPIILQNHDWKAGKLITRPTSLQANESIMKYELQDESAVFPGWNDYRFIDLRTLDVSG